MKKLLIAALAVICLSAFSASAESYTYKQGYRGNIGLGISNFQGENIFVNDFAVFETNHGYSFGNGLYVGGGIQICSYSASEDNFGMVPIYAEAKYNFLNCLISPFVDARIGANIATAKDATTGTVKGATGFMVCPMVGVDIWRFSLAFYYQVNKFKNSTGNDNILGLGLYFNW